VLANPVRHHKHTRKCQHHQADDDAGTQARENSLRKKLIWDRAVTFLGKNELDFSWEYRTENGQRVLYFTILGITVNQQTQAQAWADTNIGPGRVVVVRG